jgi:hypothetical protein
MFGLNAAASAVMLLAFATGVGAVADTLPASIPDAEFWKLSEQLSEPNGYFPSDNLASNELTLSTMAGVLAMRTTPGGVYLGVGPEQNFTYIGAMRPKIAFITDIRRGNLHLHLMYKALFELSPDRADFVSRLLTKPRPDGLSARSSAWDLMNAYWDVGTSDVATYQKNLADIYSVLTGTHGWVLSQEDRDGIAYVYHAFYWHGPSISYGARSTGQTPIGTTYADLMANRDFFTGEERSYLSTESAFAVVKDLQHRNLIVPVVGDFAGRKALRGVGQYLRDHDATVTTFYVSNVEQYLRRNNVWAAFCANVATLPLDEHSTFLRPSGAIATVSVGVRPGGMFIPGMSPTSAVTTAPITRSSVEATAAGFGPMAAEVAGCGR